MVDMERINNGTKPAMNINIEWGSIYSPLLEIKDSRRKVVRNRTILPPSAAIRID
ncbi:MAG: hypothetical protein J6A70_05730 [Prevotella sp.]|nr:hypothetical protein [Prevotella sp.]